MKWAITGVGILCLVFFLGIFVGRRSFQSPTSSPAVPAEAPSTETLPVTIETINVNTATTEQLQTLPGIGQTLAQRIVSYREANGPFEAIMELTNVDGIGESKLEAILPYISLEDPK